MLSLTIVEGLTPGNPTPSTHTFNGIGGSLGRDNRCSWVLQDPERLISTQHGKIVVLQNEYYYCDTSTNGTLLKDGRHLKAQEYCLLRSNDELIIGRYRIRVTLSATDPLHQPDDSFEALLSSFKSTQETEPEPLLLTPTPSPAPAPFYHFSEPLDGLAQPAQSIVSSQETDFLTHLCEHFNLDSRLFEQDRQEIYSLVCLILETLLTQLIALQTECLAPRTIQSEKNNPLALSVNARQAIEILLRRDNPAFLDAKAAIELTFSALERQQKLLFTALRPLINGILKELKPDKLVKESETGLGKLALFQGKQAWQQYKKTYQELTHEGADKLYRLALAKLQTYYQPTLQELR